MTQPLTLSTQTEHPAMDFDELRKQGLRLIERLDGTAWTDFNTHDPGITILEMACYAITDLSYRINYDIKDILASGGESPANRSLFSPAQVLTTHPVTLADYRKLLLDIPGVRNAWLEKKEPEHPDLVYDAPENRLDLPTASGRTAPGTPLALKGLYHVLIEDDQSRPGPDILADVSQRLHARRSLCLDFLTPKRLQPEYVAVDAEIEISITDRPEQLMAEIYQTLDRAISPVIRFRSLSHMMAQGNTMDRIMNGPSLSRGFIDDDDLENLKRKPGLRTSDIIQEIMKIPGVISINHITLSGESWYLKLDPERTPVFSVDAATLRLVRAGIPVSVEPGQAKALFSDGKHSISDKPERDRRRDLPPPRGQDRQTGRYSSIRNQFPDNYGIGATGLPQSAPARRKAMAGQLKAYLAFFDQVLANEFAQLAHVRDLFSFDAENQETYFSQLPDTGDLPGDNVFLPSPDELRSRIQRITSDTGTQDRKNRFLNHLLARFAEQFSTHTHEPGLIRDKCAFLMEYPRIGAARGSGRDYTRPVSDDGSPNPSGLEVRISRKLGIPVAGDGFYMIEHILLRPGLADRYQGLMSGTFLAEPSAPDPYSNRLSFVFHTRHAPGDPDKDGQNKIEKTLREETPAHILVRTVYLDETGWQDFSSAYHTWIEHMTHGVDLNPGTIGDSLLLRDARDRIVRLLGLGVPYPLRDLPLSYKAMVPYGLPAPITIAGAQADVLYRLCDEDGIPVTGDGTSSRFDHSTDAPRVVLQSPAVLRDITFTIQAVWEYEPVTGDQPLCLTTYLNRPVSIKVGIDTGLAVAFEPAPGQDISEEGDRITVDYEANAGVRVHKTQAGISYRLVTDSGKKTVILSDPVEGNEKSIELVSTRPFREDKPIRVQAYRSGLEKTAALLDAMLTVLVRPNPHAGLRPGTEPPVTDYDTGTVLAIETPQASVTYTLFGRELKADDYPAEGPGGIPVPNGQGRDILIRHPETVTDWENPFGFIPLGTFTRTKKETICQTGPFREDMLFIVKAEKKENGEHLQLAEAAVILVRPDPGVSVDTRSQTAGDVLKGTVVLTHTQKGVFYRLKRDPDGTLVGTPGYHQTDRGVESARVNIDFGVGSQGTPELLLPAGEIGETTTFTILAEKIFSGVIVQLPGKAVFEVAPPDPSPETPKPPPPDATTGEPEED